MEMHLASWLCDCLALPLLQEGSAGSPSLNAAAEQALGTSEHGDLVTCVQRLCRHGIGRDVLAQAFARARDGHPQELSSSRGELVLLAADDQRRVTAIVAPRELMQRAELERRAASTDITAGVSHELANALGAIAGWARLAKQGERVDEALDLIEKSAHTAWSAARKVLGDLSHGTPAAEERLVDLSAFVDEAARLLGPKALAKDVQVRTDIVAGLSLEGDRGSVWSIVWNLAANAVEAVSKGGSVELRLSPGQNGRAVLVVQDDGPGMTDEQRARAFEPYFTTKQAGTGLGLSMAKQAVAELGGEIELQSEPGAGATFRVSLPSVRRASARPSAKRSSGVFYAEPIEQRVLVVDDDAGLREMIATALSMRGAEVVCVADAQGALRQQGPFALAIVDLLLPGMRGDEILARLREAGVTKTGMLITGTEPPRQLAEGGRPDAVLRKPFELEDLFQRLSELLDDEPASPSSPSSVAS